MKTFDFKESYRKYARKQARGPHRTRPVASGIGGDFESMGCILFDLVRHCGLESDHSVVDVGCGSGRLTVQLSGLLEGQYLALESDLVALNQPNALAHRPEWRFAAPVGLSLPVADTSVDMVCFFSVFTHLVHEDSYLYLEEANRVLKPGGKAVMSFLEFEIPAHWAVFENMVSARRNSPGSHHMHQFVSRDGLNAWADATGLIVLNTWGGDQCFVPLSGPVKMSDGRIFEKEGTPGQSVCVMQKPYED